MMLYVLNAILDIRERAPNSNVQDAEEVELVAQVPFLPLVPLNFNFKFCVYFT